MARKKHKKAKKRLKYKSRESVSPDKMPVDVLAQKAMEYLNENKFRDAISHFKILLKREDNSEWRDCLFEAYKKRSDELLKKGMTKDVLVILDHIESTFTLERDPVFFIKALIAAGETKKAIQAFFSFNNDRYKESLKELESILAPLLLSLDDETLLSDSGVTKEIDNNNPLIVYRDIVSDAIKAVTDGRDDACESLIRKIPFKSPYRDYRLFLKGLISYYNNNIAEASISFKKLPQSSALKALVDNAVMIINDNSEHTRMLQFSSIPHADITYIMALNGHDIKLIKDFLIFLKAISKGNNKYSLSLFKRVFSIIDIDIMKRFAVALLVNDISLKNAYHSVFGPISSFEENRIMALQYECKYKFGEANNYWQKCISTSDDSSFEDEDERKLAIAFLYRRIASNLGKMERDYDEFWYDDDDDDYDDITEHLELSLKYDPYHIETYNRLINLNKEMKDKKETIKWTEKLLEKFPDDIPALLEASSMAYERRAFKKAIDYLDHILEFDPINREARDKKIDIHITKARKHIKEKKFHLSRKEFAAAVTLERVGERNGSVRIKWGLMEILAGETEKGKEMIKEGIESAGSSLSALFLINIEAKRMGISQLLYKEYTTELEKYLKSKVERDGVLELLKIAIPYVDIDYVGKNIDKKTTIEYLKRAIKCSFNEADILTICLYLDKVKEYKQLKEFANKGMTLYRESNMFLYYYIWGKYKGALFNLSPSDSKRIASAIEDSKKRGDLKTAGMLISLLEKLLPNMRIPFSGAMPKFEKIFQHIFGDVLDDEDDDHFDPFGEIDEDDDSSNNRDDSSSKSRRQKKDIPYTGRLF